MYSEWGVGVCMYIIPECDRLLSGQAQYTYCSLNEMKRCSILCSFRVQLWHFLTGAAAVLKVEAAVIRAHDLRSCNGS